MRSMILHLGEQRAVFNPIFYRLLALKIENGWQILATPAQAAMRAQNAIPLCSTARLRVPGCRRYGREILGKCLVLPGVCSGWRPNCPLVRQRICGSDITFVDQNQTGAARSRRGFLYFRKTNLADEVHSLL